MHVFLQVTAGLKPALRPRYHKYVHFGQQTLLLIALGRNGEGAL
jgi:hypothetical protein